jgi:hypothetical protein
MPSIDQSIAILCCPLSISIYLLERYWNICFCPSLPTNKEKKGVATLGHPGGRVRGILRYYAIEKEWWI